MQRFSHGETPDDVIRRAAHAQCPDGVPMLIRSQDEWTALAAAWNQGIDPHLEALTERSSADPSTGNVLVHPDELHVLLRRLNDLDEEMLWPAWDLGRHDYPSEQLRSEILFSLEIEEI